MKKQRTLVFISSLFLISLIFMVACEGPMGPAGANGSDGTDGVDGNVVCLQCHNLANKASKEMEYAQSTHHNSNLMYTGQTVYEYAGGRKSCGECHSHEGFVETDWTGADTLMADIAYPHEIQCATCHGFHSTFDFENDGDDFALRNTDPVTLKIDGTTVVDFEGSSNLCANCHQPRTAAPIGDANDSFSIASSHYGPHHGPQSAVIYGIGGYEIAGSKSYPTDGEHPHYAEAACVSCHMKQYTSSTSTGGHTFTPNVDNCKECHTSATSFDIEGVQTTVMALLDQLETKLQTKGVLDVDGELVTGKYPVDVAGAYFNWALCGHEDKSHGVHNPDYVIALLTNSIESL